MNETILLVATVAGALLYGNGTAVVEYLLGRLESLGVLIIRSIGEGGMWMVVALILQVIVARRIDWDMVGRAVSLGALWGVC